MTKSAALLQLKRAIRRWCDDRDQTQPIEFICETLEPIIDRALFGCPCGERRAEEFRVSEPRRCKACRRAYNAKRKRQLRVPREAPPR